MDFTDLVYAMDRWGVLEVLMPFLLIFVVIYAILQKTKIIGTGKKQYNIIVALIMATAVVVPHVMGAYPAGADIVDIINKAIPNVSVVIIAAVMFMLLLGVFGVNFKVGGKAIAPYLAIIALIIILYIFGVAAGWGNWRFPNWLDWLNDPETQALIIMLLIFAIIVGYITRDEDTASGKTALGGLGKLMDGLKQSVEEAK